MALKPTPGRDEEPSAEVIKLLAIAEQKQRFRLDPDDPLFIAATIVAASVGDGQKKTQAEFAKLIATAVNDIVTSSTMVSAAAKGHAETVINQAGDWAAEQIRTAAQEAAKTILARCEEQEARVSHLAWVAKIGAWISGGSAITAALFVGITWWMH
jgi:hypothetical protein